jgi:hypothetical protein
MIVDETESIEIFVNNQPVLSSDREMTGDQIKTLAGLPTDYALYIVRGAESVPVSGTDAVHLHEREHFRAIPAGTFGAGHAAA